jgi:hypothetical protein
MGDGYVGCTGKTRKGVTIYTEHFMKTNQLDHCVDGNLKVDFSKIQCENVRRSTVTGFLKSTHVQSVIKKPFIVNRKKACTRTGNTNM